MQNTIGSAARHTGAITVFGLLGLFAATAQADPKSCITAHATGQREAKAGHLRLATQLFTTCGSDETCPNQLRGECAELLQAVEQTVPTVIFSVLDEKNNDISTVKVFSTDELIVDGLDGRAIQIDPGKHRLRFLLPSGAVLSNDVLIREGEKNRVIRVQINEGSSEPDAKPQESPTTAPAPMPAQSAPAPITVVPPSPPPLTAWIATGAAALGFGVGATFALLGSAKKSDIDACAPNCGSAVRSTYDDLKRDYLIADIGFAVGLVSAGVATYLFLAPRDGAKEPSPKATSKSLLIRPAATPLPGGGTVLLTGRF